MSSLCFTLLFLSMHILVSFSTHQSSPFSSITRRHLLDCEDPNPFLNMTVDTAGPLDNVQLVRVTVSGILHPSVHDWIGVFTQASHNYSDCPSRKSLYLQTGDVSSLPLLCDYPLKFKFISDDPDYLICKNSSCSGDSCHAKTCSGTLTFRLINIRTSITFVFFTGGLTVPCILKVSQPLEFAAPQAPLYGHLSLADSSGTWMVVSWISQSRSPQFVEYADGRVAKSSVSSFSKKDLCSSGPARDFGWHSPGAVHTATMKNLRPSRTYSYRYGSDAVGWSPMKTFSMPPARGFPKTKFVIYGDMGKAERDNSSEHYVQPGSLQVIDALKKEVNTVDAIFHIGDISYATGFLAEWDHFLEMIQPVASRLPYMTAIGNHERDYPSSGSKYTTTDSGGERGVPYETYFRMPSRGRDKPWYSVAMGPVHLTVISTEHEWSPGSSQYSWIKHDLASVDRRVTPWIVFTGHRPMYSTQETSGLISRVLPPVDLKFAVAIEPLLQRYKVDLAVWGHVHNFERTCSLLRGLCVHRPNKDPAGVDVFNSTAFSAPVHVVVGMAGFSLDMFPKAVNAWSLTRIADFGYGRVTADREELLFEYVRTRRGATFDHFKIVK